MNGQPDRLGADDLLVDADFKRRNREIPVEQRNDHVGIGYRGTQFEIVHLKLGRTSGKVDPQAVHRNRLGNFRAPCSPQGDDKLHGFPHAGFVAVELARDLLGAHDGRGNEEGKN